jgi:hypothetical protein
MRRPGTLLVAAVVAAVLILLTATRPSGAITGGVEDTANTYSNVGGSSSTSLTAGSGARAR